MYNVHNTYIDNVSIMSLCDADTTEDLRKRGDLLDDKNVKWFSGIACVGAVLDQAFIQKDLEKVTIDNIPFSEYAHKMYVGQSVMIRFDHVEVGWPIRYTVFIKAVKIRAKESEAVPAILQFTCSIVKKRCVDSNVR